MIKLVVGLGNPGAQYADTRHNAGAWYLRRLAQHYQVLLKPVSRFNALIGQRFDQQPSLILFIPTTFMNLSGNAIAKFASFHRILPEEILVAHDDLDLPVGAIKFKQGGGHAGHNGLKDIIHQLAGCRDFYRLRLGIGHPGSKALVVNYVLSRPSPSECQQLDQAIVQAVEATNTLIEKS